MPNWTANELIIRGEIDQVNEVLSAIKGKGEHQVIDFNKIIPMPEELHDVISPVRIISKSQYKKDKVKMEKAKITDPNGFNTQCGITKELQQEYLEKYGADNWYDWACKNWGVKWNVFEGFLEMRPVKNPNSSFVEAVLNFDTPWCPPFPIYKKISELFPNITLEASCSDEDASSGCGTCKIIGGTILELDEFENGSPEAWQMYFRLHPGDEEYWVQKEDGSYEFDENYYINATSLENPVDTAVKELGDAVGKLSNEVKKKLKK